MLPLADPIPALPRLALVDDYCVVSEQGDDRIDVATRVSPEEALHRTWTL